MSADAALFFAQMLTITNQNQVTWR